MAAYLIVYDTITDPARFRAYGETVEPLIRSYGGRMAAANAPDVLEGEWPWDRAVVFEWPTREGLLAFWNSEEYAEARKLREGAAVFQAIAVEGIAIPR